MSLAGWSPPHQGQEGRTVHLTRREFQTGDATKHQTACSLRKIAICNVRMSSQSECQAMVVKRSSPQDIERLPIEERLCKHRYELMVFYQNVLNS